VSITLVNAGPLWGAGEAARGNGSAAAGFAEGDLLPFPVFPRMFLHAPKPGRSMPSPSRPAPNKKAAPSGGTPETYVLLKLYVVILSEG